MLLPLQPGLSLLLAKSLSPAVGLVSLCLAPLPRELGREAAACQLVFASSFFMIALRVSFIVLNCACVSVL